MIKLGISSWAFRYAVGFKGFDNPNPMGIKDFIIKSEELGYKRIQLCENLNYASCEKSQLQECSNLALEKGMDVEIGMNNLSTENIMKHIELCEIFRSKLIRLVVGNIGKTHEETYEKAFHRLKDISGMLRAKGIKIGIENHFDLPTEYIVKLIKALDTELVGAIYDTTNAIGFIEKPEYTLELLLPHIFSIHIKDYIVKKAEASYVMTGTVLGEGQLDALRVLQKVYSQNKNATVILEMTVKRRDNCSISEAILEEAIQIEKSTAKLKELAKSF